MFLLKVQLKWWNKSACQFQPTPAAYNHAVDEQEHTVEQWKGTAKVQKLSDVQKITVISQNLNTMNACSIDKQCRPRLDCSFWSIWWSQSTIFAQTCLLKYFELLQYCFVISDIILEPVWTLKYQSKIILEHYGTSLKLFWNVMVPV